jgi:aquaporin Z
MHDMVRRAVAEMFGTFALVFFGCGAVVMEAFPSARYGILGIALIHAVVLSVAVSATMAVSGGHLNPAVSLGLLVTRRINLPTFGVYVAAQLVAAVLAVMACQALLPASVGDSVTWGTPVLSSRMTFGQGVALEALLTFFLMSAVMGTIVSQKAPRIAGFGVGLTLIFAIMIGGPLTGAALNPARAFGPAIMSGNFTAHAAYWLGPCIGAVIAALLWDRVILPREDAA